jgi:hypothetical protein
MDSAGDLEDRRRRLRLRADAQRRDIANQLAAVLEPVGDVDRRLGALRRWLGHPVAIGLAVLVAVVVGRNASAGRIGALASLASAGWSLRRLLLADAPSSSQNSRRP